jgi:excisionase family DNA binding protein
MRESKIVPQEKPVRGELLTIAEAVAKYRIKKDTLYRLIKKNELRRVKLPCSLTRVHSGDIDALIQKYED